jgi:hypothetical protein
MEEKKKRGRPKKIVVNGQLPESEIREIAEKTKGIRRLDPLIPEIEVALYNAAHPDQLTETYTVPYPTDWDKMTKTEKLAYFTKHRK